LRSIHWAAEFAALALRYGERPAVVDSYGTTSYAQLFAKAAGVGHAVTMAGTVPGDAVATLFRNGADAVAATFGVMMAGAVEVPINPALSAAERTHCLAISDAGLVVTSAEFAGGLIAEQRATLSIDDVKQTALDPAAFPLVDGDKPARIVFTSGTTGLPKGAVHSQHGRWTANILLRASLPFQPDADSNVLLMTPISHGSSLMTHAYLSSGASVTLLDGVDPPAVLGILERGECDAMFAPPTVLAKIVAAAGERRFSSLRTIFCGTAVLKPTLYARARAMFGPVVRVTYGKSEMFNPITVLEAEETEAWYAGGGDDACVGWPAAGVEIVVRGEDGKPAAPGECGEVTLRAQHLMMGYRTAEGFSPLARCEFHDTGDLGYVDALGRLHLTGRTADVIKSGGYKVTPEEVERMLAPALQPSEVAVVGIPQDYWGEVILAAIERPAPGWEERVDVAVRGMTDYKRPRLMIALEELPRNGIGKILRGAIRADVLSRFRLTEGPRPRLEKRE
jgi:acyl-CoA synthetase (AMP-forming)/AMP-acid ligase II